MSLAAASVTAARTAARIEALANISVGRITKVGVAKSVWGSTRSVDCVMKEKDESLEERQEDWSSYRTAGDELEAKSRHLLCNLACSLDSGSSLGVEPILLAAHSKPIHSLRL